MSVLDEEPDKLLLDWWTRSPNLKIISQLDGTIEEANEAFCEWSNYTIHEFKRQKNPINWIQITLADESLEADRAMAEKCMKGEVEAYKIQKHYIPKGEMPRLCELHIMRYPRQGGENEFKCFLVDVRPLCSSETMLIETLTILQREMRSVVESVQHMATIGNLFQWANENKLISVPIGIVLGYLLFGDRAVEIAKQFFTGGGQ